MTSDGSKVLPCNEETDGQLAVGQLCGGRRPPQSDRVEADDDR